MEVKRNDSRMSIEEALEQVVRIEGKLYDKSQLTEISIPDSDAGRFKFDSYFHELAREISDDKYSDDTIIETARGGYKLTETGKVLRKARVVVNRRF